MYYLEAISVSQIVTDCMTFILVDLQSEWEAQNKVETQTENNCTTERNERTANKQRRDPSRRTKKKKHQQIKDDVKHREKTIIVCNI